MALQQAERYGTPLAQTLRVLAQENRDMRMSEAEKKAAGAAAQAHRADDPVLPAGAVRRHSRPGRDPRDGHQLSRSCECQAARAPSEASAAHRQRLLCYRSGVRSRLLSSSFCCASICAQVGDLAAASSGGRSARTIVSASCEAALQADHQREILPHARLGALLRARPPQASPRLASDPSTARRTGRDWTAPRARPA